MALEHLCDFHNILKDQVTTERSAVLLSKTILHSYARDVAFSKSRNLFHFYIPVAEYLDESPIQFGQISAVSSPVSSAPSSCLPSSLPFASLQSVPPPFPLSHGTTTLAFIFQGGVLAAADTRSSCSGLVACPASQKVLPINSHMVGTTSGTSADCALWKRILARELRLHQLRNGRRLSTGGAAKLLSHMLHPFKGTELCVAATLCGWDGEEMNDGCRSHRSTEIGFSSCGKTSEKSEQEMFGSPTSERRHERGKSSYSGPSLYYVCSDGTRLKGSLFSVGSGSPYAYSILDQGVHWGLTVDQAVSVAREAVYRATHRDAYSGNCVDVFHITSKGWTRRKREDLKEEYYREKEKQTHEGGRKTESGERQKQEAMLSVKT